MADVRVIPSRVLPCLPICVQYGHQVDQNLRKERWARCQCWRRISSDLGSRCDIGKPEFGTKIHYPQMQALKSNTYILDAQ